MQRNAIAMKVSCWLSIALGLWTLHLSIRGVLSANYVAALGVFFIFMGFNGFTSLHIKKLEEAIKEMKEKNEKQH